MQLPTVSVMLTSNADEGFYFESTKDVFDFISSKGYTEEQARRIVRGEVPRHLPILKELWEKFGDPNDSMFEVVISPGAYFIEEYVPEPSTTGYVVGLGTPGNAHSVFIPEFERPTTENLVVSFCDTSEGIDDRDKLGRESAVFRIAGFNGDEQSGLTKEDVSDNSRLILENLFFPYDNAEDEVVIAGRKVTIHHSPYRLRRFHTLNLTISSEEGVAMSVSLKGLLDNGADAAAWREDIKRFLILE